MQTHVQRRFLAAFSALLFFWTTSVFAPPTTRILSYTEEANDIHTRAWIRANDQNHLQVTPTHFLIELLSTDSRTVDDLVRTFKLDRDALIQEALFELFEMKERPAALPGNAPDVAPTPTYASIGEAYAGITRRAEELSKTLKETKGVSTYSVFLALAEQHAGLKKIMIAHKADAEKQLAVVKRLLDGEVPKIDEDAKAEISEARKFLKTITLDLTDRARKGLLPPRIGQQSIVEGIVKVLLQREANNPLLLGEAGVGKTAAFEAFAQYLVSEGVDPRFKGKRFLVLDLGSLMAGAKEQGELEKRMKLAIQGIQEEGNVILGIDELHQLMNVGKSQGALSAADTLKPLWSRGELPTVGATTVDEYTKYIEKDAALVRRFGQVKMAAPTTEETVTILYGLRHVFEQHYGIEISDEALVAAASLSNRYITDRALPAKAVNLLDQACADLRTQTINKPKHLSRAEERLTGLSTVIAGIKLDLQRLKAMQARRGTPDEELAIRIRRGEALLKLNEASYLEQSELIAPALKEWASAKDLIKEIARKQGEVRFVTTMMTTFIEKSKYAEAEKVRYKQLIPLTQKIAALQQDLLKFSLIGSLASRRLEADHVAEIISQQTGIPAGNMLKEERERLLRMRDELKESVMGQDHAIEIIAQAYERARAGLKDPNRPLGSFFFAGPTGTGKTELARALAKFIFNDPLAMVRLDMSEYQEKTSVNRLIGAPPGYVGYEESGQLTEKVRKRPYSVVLFDEIEKAHPNVWDVLLQILDEGRITDGQGRTVDFKNTIVIVTTNVGAKIITGEIKPEDGMSKAEAFLQAFHQVFRPEFIARFDALVPFRMISQEIAEHIIQLQVNKLNKERLTAKGLTVTITAAAKAHLVLVAMKKSGGNAGARPLKTIVQDEVVNALAHNLNRDELKDGDVIEVDLDLSGVEVGTDALADAGKGKLSLRRVARVDEACPKTLDVPELVPILF